MTWISPMIRWALACAIAAATYLAAYASGSLPLVGNAREQTADILSKLRADFIPPRPGAPALVYVDIDQETYARLEWPTIMPRGPLATLLREIALAHPSLIVLDTDIGWPGDPQGSAELTATLEQLGDGDTPVLMARTLLRDGRSRDVLRATPFDKVVDKSRTLSWVIADARRSSDGIIRKTRPWSVYCSEGEQRPILSAAMAAWAVLQSKGSLKPRVVGYENRPPCPSQEGSFELSSPERLTIEIGTGSRVFRSQDIEQIDYSMSWQLEAGEARPTIATKAGVQVPAIVLIPALPLLTRMAQVDSRLFSGRVVLIGSSAAEQRDLHVTPIGLMPGAMVIANQFASYDGDFVDGNSTLLFGLICVVVLGTVVVFASFAMNFFLGRILAQHLPVFSSHLQAATSGLFAFALFQILPGPTTEFVFLLTSYLVGVVLTVVPLHEAARGATRTEAK